MIENTAKPRGFTSSVYRALFGDFPRDQVIWPLARFADRKIEQDYLNYLVKNDLPKERLVNYLGVFLYVAFGILDVITFDEQLPEVLALRLGLCAPIGLILTSLSYMDRFKPHFQYLTAGVLLTGSGSIVIMIGMMPPEGAPPYIIGILTVFIVYSCLQRLSFPIAASIYLLVSVAYSITVVFISPKAGAEIAAGHFFMVTITFTALVTSFIQEVRSRIDFYRRRQREIDASFIEKLLIEATAADRAKNSFLSVLSHELRTPLHQIVGFSEVVKNQIANDPKADPTTYLDDIHTSARGLLGSISKMLRYADATAGKMSYDLTDCSAEYLVEIIVDQARAKAEAALVRLVVGDLQSATLQIDHLHTAYALGQLIENSIAASPPGGTIEFSGECDGNGGYTLKIIDQGCGMSAEQINAAFTPFMQAEEFKTRTMEGVGLGLSLSKKILDDQHTELSLESSVGAGTTAIIRFPLKETVSTEESAA
ncbi:MAG: HAMP domain-containing histidine kinase [Marinicaulis sp.]|nr:HAMP domain-containing histidine kinase [Marinicaulis sp.]